MIQNRPPFWRLRMLKQVQLHSTSQTLFVEGGFRSATLGLYHLAKRVWTAVVSFFQRLFRGEFCRKAKEPHQEVIRPVPVVAPVVQVVPQNKPIPEPVAPPLELAPRPEQKPPVQPPPPRPPPFQRPPIPPFDRPLPQRLPIHDAPLPPDPRMPVVAPPAQEPQAAVTPRIDRRLLLESLNYLSVRQNILGAVLEPSERVVVQVALEEEGLPPPLSTLVVIALKAVSTTGLGSFLNKKKINQNDLLSTVIKAQLRSKLLNGNGLGVREIIDSFEDIKCPIEHPMDLKDGMKYLEEDAEKSFYGMGLLAVKTDQEESLVFSVLSYIKTGKKIFYLFHYLPGSKTYELHSFGSGQDLNNYIKDFCTIQSSELYPIELK